MVLTMKQLTTSLYLKSDSAVLIKLKAFSLVNYFYKLASN